MGLCRLRLVFRGLAVAVTSLIVVTAGRATPALDQQQPVIDSSASFLIAIGGGAAGQHVAQVVRPGVIGYLTEVRFPVACLPDSDLVVEIQNADQGAAPGPAGAVLARQVIPAAALPPSDWASFHSIGFSTPAFLPGQTAFAVVLSSAGNCSVTPGPKGDPYLRGSAFYKSSGPWTCFCADRDDLPFQTYVEAACLVPAVVGSRKGPALAQLAKYGCSVGRVTTRYSSKRAKGVVLSTMPAAATSLPSHGPVDVVVSKGAACVVPNVVGKTLGAARRAIRARGCRVGRVRTIASRVRVGHVIAQVPRGGRTVPQGTAVNLALSRG